MNVKRFVAADMRRALELVKQEMGDDAIILSSKRVKNGVEILTSTHLPYEQARQTSLSADSNSSYANLSKVSSTAKSNFSDSVPDASPMASDDAWSWDSLLGRSNQGVRKVEQNRGPASGKTQHELAREIEIARRKMEAADRIPLAQQVDSRPSFRQQLQRRPTPLQDQVDEVRRPAPVLKSKTKDVPRIEPHISPAGDMDLLDEYESFTNGPRHDCHDIQSHTDSNLPQNHSNNIEQPAFFMPTYSLNTSTVGDQFICFPPADNHLASSTVEEAEGDKQFEALKNEISDMREMLHIQLERLAHVDDNKRVGKRDNTISLASAIKATIARRLIQMGINKTDTDGILSAVKVRAGLAETWADVLAHIAHKINVTRNDLVQQGGIFALVGSSGVGKTSVISKLATQFVLNNPSRRLSLIVFDPGERGASSLNRLGKILDTTVRTARDRISLTRALADCCDSDLVLIDTPSPAQCRQQGIDLLATLGRLPQIENLLVLPATAQEKLLQATVDEFNNIAVKACVLTKLDESLSLGEVLSLCLRTSLSLAYVTEGQAIPNDINLARSHQLIAKSVALLKKTTKPTAKTSLASRVHQSGRHSLTA